MRGEAQQRIVTTFGIIMHAIWFKIYEGRNMPSPLTLYGAAAIYLSIIFLSHLPTS